MAKKKKHYAIGRALSIVRKFHPTVKKVVDATSNLDIEVTNHDVRTSARSSHKGCAAAVACKRMEHLDGVIMSRAIAYLIKDKVATRYEVPRSLNREIIAFDRGGTFEPGEYTLLKPDTSIRLGVQRPVSTSIERTGNNKVIRHMTTNIRAALGGVKRAS